MEENKLTEEEIKIFESCKTLPEEFAEATDFKAEEAIALDYSIELPESYSLGKRIYKTSNQGGLGSCFPGDTKILMGDFSYKSISQIQPDDVVYTYEGLRAIDKKFELGEKDLISISISKIRGNKSKIKCTPDHKFFVYKDGEEITKEAKDLELGDYLLMPIFNIEEEDNEYIDTTKFLSGDIVESSDGKYIMKNVGKTRSKILKQIPLTNNLLRLFGFYTAEGCVLFDGGCIHGLSLTFHKEEKDYIEFCKNELELLSPGCSVNINIKKDSKAVAVRVGNALLGELFYNLFNHLCYNKTIPDIIYKLPIDRFKVYLHSLVEGDGYFTKGNNEIGLTITADRVMNMISNKLYFNGIHHSIEIRNNSVETQERADIYGIYLYGDSAVWLMPEIFSHKKSSKPEQDIFVTIDGNKYVGKKIKDIEESYSELVYNLEVEGNHTYCVNRIKVHNCTSMGTTHGVQILNVKKGGVEPTDRNIITPLRKDLRSKMGHSTEKYDGGDYVEKAVSTALKEGILIEENGQLARFDAYATDEWTHDDKAFEKMKRYLYKGCPIVWCVQGNVTMWNEMTAGEVKTVPNKTTGGHCIALVGWDKGGMRFVNSWRPNDGKGLKSRFYITYDVMKKLGRRLNYRYWVLYMKEDEKKDAEYLKRKNAHLLVLQTLKKYYPEENAEVKKGIEAYSASVRKAYPELNEELPK